MLVNYGLAALTGLLMVLIHPRVSLTLLAPFVLSPLLLLTAILAYWALGRRRY